MDARRYQSTDVKTCTRTYAEDSLFYDLPRLLHYEDRNAAAFSVEVRLPFLDHSLAEAVLAMPAEYKLRGGRTKAVLRRAMDSVVPGEIRDRQDKMGFVTPENKWFQENRSYFRELLYNACERLSPLVNTKDVMRRFDSGKDFRSTDETLWRIMCAGQWVKTFGISYPLRENQ